MPSGFQFGEVHISKKVRSSLGRVWTQTTFYATNLYQELFAKQVFLWAQAVAFKAIVTFVPIVILATGLLGHLMEGQNAFQTLTPFIRGLLPESQNKEIVKFLTEVQAASGTIVGIGSIGLFLSAVSLMNTLRIAVSNAFDKGQHKARSLLGRYAFDARMVVQVGIFFFLTVGLSVLLPPFLDDVFVQKISAFMQQFHRGGQQIIRLFVPLLLTMAIFFQLYYFVPKPRPSKRSVLVGTLVASFLWETTKQAFTYYASYVGRFGHFSSSGDRLSAVGSTFGLLVAFMVWVYLSGVLLVVGAIVVNLCERRRASTPEESSQSDAPSSEAVPPS